MKRELICTICPRGCTLLAEEENGTVRVTGNACPRGAQYAADECTHPVRTVTSAVRVANRQDTMVSVKTTVPVSKADMAAVMQRIRAASVDAPIQLGDVLLRDVCGADVVATKTIR